MRSSVIALPLACLFFATGVAEAKDDPKKEIRQVLDAQVQAWNMGDIDGFMKGYWNSDTTIFTSNGRITRGWNAMLARYKKTYGDGKMGLLTFSDLEIDLLSRDVAMVLGHWELRRGNENNGGVFTLLFRKVKQGWRIAVDHTSNSN